MKSFLYENKADQLTDNNYIKLNFKGEQPNLFAIGTTVWMYYDDSVIMQELIPSRGFQSSVDYGMTIGLGDKTQVDSLRIVWPDDRTQLLTNVVSNQTLELSQSEAVEKFVPYKEPQPEKILKEIPGDELIAHVENTYNDFDFEGMISKKLSQEGPALAIGDFDQDGNEDVFVGGAKKQTGVIYLHKGDGQLIPMTQSILEEENYYEDTAAAFFDADGDGDLDLVVGTGGNETSDENIYRARLYLNDGQRSIDWFDRTIAGRVQEHLSDPTFGLRRRWRRRPFHRIEKRSRRIRPRPEPLVA